MNVPIITYFRENGIEFRKNYRENEKPEQKICSGSLCV